MTDLFSGLFILAAIAAVTAWFWPEMLIWLAARLFARARALDASRLAYQRAHGEAVAQVEAMAGKEAGVVEAEA